MASHNTIDRRPPDDGDGRLVEQLEHLLSECEKRYERLVESSPDVIYRLALRPEVRFEYINSAAERVLGYPMETFESAGMDFFEQLVVEDDQSDIYDIAAGRTFFSSRLRHMRRGDGTIIWAEVHNIPVYDEHGTLVAQEGTVRDVTEHVRALDELRAAEERQRRLTESLPDLMFRLDESGRLAEHVPTASKQPAKVFLGKALEEVVASESLEAAQQALKKAWAGESSAFRSRVVIRGDGRGYEFRLVPTGSGDILAFLRDVTGEVWAEEELERRHSRDRIEGTVEKQIGIRNPYQFTFREFTVLHLVAQGAADKEIANELGIALSTVNKHVSNVLAKMNAGSRTEAGVRGVQEGLVDARR